MAPILLRHRCCAADPDQVDLCIRRLPDEREVTAQEPSREPPGFACWRAGLGGPRGEGGGGQQEGDEQATAHDDDSGGKGARK